MERKRIFATMAVFLIVCVHVESTFVRLRSLYKVSYCGGGGGNLIKIYANQCSITAAKVQCKVKCDGSGPTNFTKFDMIPRTGGRKCIQFEMNGQNYGLKVISGTHPVKLVFERQNCSAAGDDFLFEEHRTIHFGRYAYEHIVNGTRMCLTGLCDGTLTLSAASSPKIDRKCQFKKIPVYK